MLRHRLRPPLGRPAHRPTVLHGSAARAHRHLPHAPALAPSGLSGEFKAEVALRHGLRAAGGNTVVKAIMALVRGGKVRGVRVAAVSAAMLAAGLIVMFVS